MELQNQSNREYDFAPFKLLHTAVHAASIWVWAKRPVDLELVSCTAMRLRAMRAIKVTALTHLCTTLDGSLCRTLAGLLCHTVDGLLLLKIWLRMMREHYPFLCMSQWLSTLPSPFEEFPAATGACKAKLRSISNHTFKALNGQCWDMFDFMKL